MKVHCSFGRRASNDEVTPFEVKYLRHQVDFADSEIGDQIDHSTPPIESLGATEIMAFGWANVAGFAEGVQYCLQKRYLGECAIGCETRRYIDELSEEQHDMMK